MMRLSPMGFFWVLLVALLVIVGAVWASGASAQSQAGVLLIGTWLLVGLLGAKAQWERGGGMGLGFVVSIIFGPLGLLVANYSGGRRCRHCKRTGLHREATRCPHCGGEA